MTDQIDNNNLKEYFDKFVLSNITDDFIQHALLLPYLSKDELVNMGYDEELIDKLKNIFA